MLQELEELYIPANERQLRDIQRRGEELDRQVRNWAHAVIRVLPRGLPLNADETYIFSLFLAQQRRLNQEMDSYQTPEPSVWNALRQVLPVATPRANPEIIRATHRIVALRLDSDIERATAFFCKDRGIPPDCEPAIDWRVAIRFLAQSIYSRVANVDLRKVHSSPARFELALVARDLAADVVEKRHLMFEACHDRRQANAS